MAFAVTGIIVLVVLVGLPALMFSYTRKGDTAEHKVWVFIVWAIVSLAAVFIVLYSLIR